MDLRKIKTLLDLVSESNVTEFEITEGEEKVRIVKGVAPAAAPAVMYAPAPAMAAPVALAPAAAPAQLSAAAPTAIVAEAAAPAGNIIKSPMVGTFYRSPSPEKASFADIGTKVTANQTVCIIEAMKLMNEIESGFDGTITKILVENGSTVEFGQPLFVVE